MWNPLVSVPSITRVKVSGAFSRKPARRLNAGLLSRMSIRPRASIGHHDLLGRMRWKTSPSISGTPTRGLDHGDHGLALRRPLAVVDRDVGPGRANSRAQPRPIPRAAPVTRPVLPLSFMMDALLSIRLSIVSLPIP